VLPRGGLGADRLTRPLADSVLVAPAPVDNVGIVMAEYDLILVMAVFLGGVFAGCWYSRFRCRLRDIPPERQWPGHGIDVARATERVHRVRHDYVSELQARSRRSSRHADLLVMVGKFVGRRPYFRNRLREHTITGQDGVR